MSSGPANGDIHDSHTDPSQYRLLLWLIWSYVLISGIAVVAFYMPSKSEFQTYVLICVLAITVVGFYLALQALLRGKFSLMLFALFSPGLAAAVCARSGLDDAWADLTAPFVVPTALNLNLVVVLVWAVAETAGLRGIDRPPAIGLAIDSPASACSICSF